MTPLLRADGVELNTRLEATSLQLEAGSMTALIGPNGSGKTSLLRALAGVERSSGTVTIEGDDLRRTSPSRRRQLVSFLPASREVVWPVAVEDIVGLGLAGPDPTRVSQLLAQLDLEHLRHRAINRLSTGERARALLARALAARPRVLLLDEPLSNLDPYHLLNTLRVLQQAADEGAAVLVSVHDLATLGKFDRALLMHDGRLVFDGSGPNVLASEQFRQAFRVEPEGSSPKVRAGGCRFRRPAGPQSSR